MAGTCDKCKKYWDISSNSFFWTYIDPDDGYSLKEGYVCDSCFKKLEKEKETKIMERNPAIFEEDEAR